MPSPQALGPALIPTLESFLLAPRMAQFGCLSYSFFLLGTRRRKFECVLGLDGAGSRRTLVPSMLPPMAPSNSRGPCPGTAPTPDCPIPLLLKIPAGIGVLPTGMRGHHEEP